MKTHDDSLIGCGVMITIFAFVIMIFAILACWTDRNLDFWLSHFAGHAVDVPMWLSFLVTVVGNAFVMITNIIAEIARFLI